MAALSLCALSWPHVAMAQQQESATPAPEAGAAPVVEEATPVPAAQPLPPVIDEASEAPSATDEEVRTMVEALASDLSSLRESLYLPEDEAKRSVYGMGPAASKVYGRPAGLSIGGYGETYYQHDLNRGEASNADALRFIAYLGYKFNDWIVMNSEIEFEHATTGTNPANGRSGSVSVEFSYLDLLFHPAFNFRSGLLLVPSGITNELHEPTTYLGNFRPQVEQRIIPTTWRELGVGAFGQLFDSLTYKAYLIAGLSADGFDSTGVRGGRQKGNRSAAEDVGGILRLDYQALDELNVGGSFYLGGADHDPSRTRSESNGIAETHFTARFAGAELSGLFAYSFIDVDPMADDTEREQVPSRQWGGYLSGYYNALPHFVDKPQAKAGPFFRIEAMNLRAEPSPEDPTLKTVEVLGGVEVKPIPDIVFKAEFSNTTDDTNARSEKAVRLGLGFLY